MEFKVQDFKAPEALSFNYEELKQELTTRLHDYKTVVYTADMIKQAKADRSTLNGLKKALNDERIRLEREYMLPFMDFKNKVAELCGLIDQAASAVDSQVKAFEEKAKEEKKEGIQSLFNVYFEDQPWMRIDFIWNPKWLNASYSMKQIDLDLSNWKTVIQNELEVLGRLKEYSFEAIECYKQCMNLNEAIKYADNLAQIAEAKAKAKAEAEAKEEKTIAEQAIANEQYVAVEPEPQEIEVIPEQVEDLPIAEEPERVWLNFSVHVSMEEAKELAALLKGAGIEYKRI